MNNEKKYVGNGKKVGNYDMINFSVCLSDIPKDLIYEYNGKKYINLTIGAKKEVDKYGKSHAIWLNEFKPEEKKADPKPDETTDLAF